MLQYEWGNPSPIVLAGNDSAAATESELIHRQIFDHFPLSQPQHGSTITSVTTTTPDLSFHNNFNTSQSYQHHPFFDPRALPSASPTSFTPTPSLLPPDQFTSTHCGLKPAGLFLASKPEDITRPMEFGSSGLGLNLGGRTYLASSADDIVNRLYRQSKTVEISCTNVPRCQVEGCNADLSNSKHYHRRHKVCELHSKAAMVVAAGLTQRFCQQCSRLWFCSSRWGNFTQ